MGAIMDGEATPAQIGALLAGAGRARRDRGRGRRLRAGDARAGGAARAPQGAVDTCGTGGDGAGTFNISTVAAFVVAACGVPVAKHGNRSASGSCGSADVLEALGVRIDAPRGHRAARRSTRSAGLPLRARRSTPRRATRSAPRRELGVRTVFNLLGPLTNPARPEAQVVGVPRAGAGAVRRALLQRLGTKRAWVVHGSGLDELTLAGPTTVAELRRRRRADLHGHAGGRGPRAAPPLEALRGGDPQANAAIAREILAGAPGPRRDVVLLNAAAALVVAGPRAGPARRASRQAAAAIDDGRARAPARARARGAAHERPSDALRPRRDPRADARARGGASGAPAARRLAARR